jgi:hypothetical protein
MSERQIHDPQSTPPAPTPVDASAAGLASARRRRLIKMGAGAIPVALTLSSRPVLATSQGKCFSASAWGSIQNVATTASTYTRKSTKAPTVTCYTKTEWCATTTGTSSGTPTCGGWKVAAISCSTSSAVKNYTVTKACGTSAGTAGVVGTKLIWERLNASDTSCTPHQKAMLVAWLNFRISGTTSTDVCVIDSFSSNQLTTLGNIVASGSGTGPDGKTWSKDNVKDYLDKNYIGRLT